MRGGALERGSFAFALLLGLASGLGAEAQAQEPADAHARVRGVTVSCQTWGKEWGSDAMLVAMDEIKALGGNWIAIHPYAGIRGDGTVREWRLGEETPRWLSRPIAEAHARGLKILIKPHLAYWGSKFSWRGEIEFQTDAEWERFWSGYAAWIVKLARLCAGADAFCVGTELGKTTPQEARWRALIAKTRAVTKAPLTYAANWDHYQKVGFWDALDVIGVQAYFPLVAHAGRPTDAELRAGWRRVLAEVSDCSRQADRKVLFTELGYNRSLKAAREPWDHESDASDAAAELQRRCTSAALSALEGHPTVVGAFLWKWFPGAARREDFSLSTPRMRRAIREVWGKHEPRSR